MTGAGTGLRLEVNLVNFNRNITQIILYGKLP